MVARRTSTLARLGATDLLGRIKTSSKSSLSSVSTLIVDFLSRFFGIPTTPNPIMGVKQKAPPEISSSGFLSFVFRGAGSRR